MLDVVENRLKTYRRTVFLVGVLHWLAGLFLFFFPAHSFQILNFPTHYLKLIEPVASPTDGYLIIFTSAYLILVGTLCFRNAQAPRMRSLAWSIILTKILTTCAFGYLFFTEAKHFAYLVGGLYEGFFVIVFLLQQILLPRAKALDIAPTEDSLPLPVENPPTGNHFEISSEGVPKI